MQINEDDPLGIKSGGINMDDPLGIKGPIQKMKPTFTGENRADPPNATNIGLMGLLDTGAASFLNSMKDLFTGNQLGLIPPKREFVISPGQQTLGTVPVPPTFQPGVSIFGENPNDTPFVSQLRGMGTPFNLAATPFVGGEGAVARAAAGLFGLEGISGAIHDVPKVFNPETREEGLASLPMDLLMGVGGTRHTLHEAPIGPQVTLPGARRLRQLQSDGSLGTAHDIVSEVAGDANSPYQGLANEMLKARGDDLKKTRLFVNRNLKAAGEFDKQTKQIDVHPNFVGNDFALLHEIGHSLTNEGLDKGFGEGLRELFEKVKPQLEKEGLHGAKNLDEFTTELLTNPGFQQKLKQMRGSNRGFVDQVVDETLAAIGRSRVKGSVLEQGGSMAFDVMSKNPRSLPSAPRSSMMDVPSIGQRPLTIEQPIVSSYQVNPQDPLQIEKGVGFTGEPKQGGQISFQGQGIPSAMQSRVMPKGEQSEQAALMQGQFIPSTKEGRLHSGITFNDSWEEVEKQTGAWMDSSGKLLAVNYHPESGGIVLEKKHGIKIPLPHDEESGVYETMQNKGYLRVTYNNSLTGKVAYIQEREASPKQMAELKNLAIENGFRIEGSKGVIFDPTSEQSKFQSGLNPDDLLPAINFAGKLLIGRQGDTHADILEHNGIDPSAVSHPDPARGFVNAKTGQFLSRLEAQKESGITGTAKAGGLDSMDLPGAAKTKVMRDSGFSDSEIKETLGSKLQSGLNYDKILPGGKDDPMFPILTRIQDAGYETLYSEHGMGEGDSTPYVVFKRTSADKDARIKEAAKVVGAEVEERPKRIGVYLKESDKVEDIKKDWESFTKHLGGGTKLQSGIGYDLPSIHEEFKRLQGYNKKGFNDERTYPQRFLEKVTEDMQHNNELQRLARKFHQGKLYHHLWDYIDQYENGKAPDSNSYRTPAGVKAIGEYFKKNFPDTYEFARIGSTDYKDRIKDISLDLLHRSGVDIHRAIQALGDPQEWEELVEQGDVPEELVKDIDYTLFEKNVNSSDYRTKLHSGLPIFDEKLWGSKDKVEKEQQESVKLGLGQQPITSLPLDPDPESVNKTTTKLNSGLIPALTGYGVDRPLNEVIEAFAAKQAGWSAPRHIAANEELGNALVRVAASDIASVMESKASSPAVAASYKQNTFKLLYDAYINSGFGQAVVRGVPAPVMGGKPMELVHINKKPLWIRSDLEPEFSQALQTDSRVRKAGAALLMDLATELQVIGLTDFTFHGANMFGSIAYDLGAKTTEGDLVRGTVPGARHIDAMMRIGHEMRRVILDDPAVRRELADIAKIGALRAEEQGQSLISKTPVVGKYIDMGRWIQLFDKAGRLARNKMFDNLVDRKLIKDTELDRREFINKMGQYNARLMSKFQDFQRQYVSQFVVAGRTFNRNAFQRVFMSNQARALNPGAYAKMKALNAASLFSALLVTPVVFNMWTTGKPFGRKGTDIGSVDTGKDDENGRPIQIDILQTTLLRRGFRNVGLQALQKDIRAGKDFGTTATDMGRDVANGLIHPWAGPPIRAGWTAITGKSVGFGGFPLSKDTDSLTDNFLAGLSQVNPMVAAAYDKNAKGDKADGYFQRTAAAVGLKKGPFPTHEDDLEKETGKKVGEMSLGERVQAEKSHKEKAEKLPPETKAKAAERSIANITKRGEELSKQMTKADRQWMESRGLNVPGFDNKIHAGKTLVYLTKDEMERLSKYTLEAYSEAMPEVRQKYPQLGESSKDVYFNARMSAARGKARTRLIQELNSLNESNQKTKKRFTVFDNE